MIEYSLVGIDGNASAIIAYTKKAMKAEKKSASEISAYEKDAWSGSYIHCIALSRDMLSKLNGTHCVALSPDMLLKLNGTDDE